MINEWPLMNQNWTVCPVLSISHVINKYSKFEPKISVFHVLPVTTTTANYNTRRPLMMRFHNAASFVCPRQLSHSRWPLNFAHQFGLLSLWLRWWALNCSEFVNICWQNGQTDSGRIFRCSRSTGSGGFQCSSGWSALVQCFCLFVCTMLITEGLWFLTTIVSVWDPEPDSNLEAQSDPESNSDFVVENLRSSFSVSLFPSEVQSCWGPPTGPVIEFLCVFLSFAGSEKEHAATLLLSSLFRSPASFSLALWLFLTVPDWEGIFCTSHPSDLSSALCLTSPALQLSNGGTDSCWMQWWREG